MSKAKRPQSLSPEILRSLVQRGPSRSSGPEIAAARIAGSRSTFPTRKRWLMWSRKKKNPAHVGKKQQAKIRDSINFTGSVSPL